MDRTGQTPNRVGHRMDDVASQGKSVAFAQRFGACALDSAPRLARQPPPQDVVLATRVDADDGPHLVVVGHDGHPWPPDDIQDREISRAVERLDLRAAWLTQRLQDRPGSLDRPGYDFTHGLLGPRPSDSGTAVGFEKVEINHGHGLLLGGIPQYRNRAALFRTSNASWWRRRPQPERACLADLLEIRAALCRPLREPGGEIICVEHMVSRLGAEKPRELGEADEALLGPGVELRPASSVLFRPEEVHARSEKRRAGPPPARDRHY